MTSLLSRWSDRLITARIGTFLATMWHLRVMAALRCISEVGNKRPLTNLNSGLSTNLVLGLNSISEVTVNTLSYAVDQGRYGASQVNYITKSGSNQFHWNLYELWNGAKFNAANYFTNTITGNRKPRSTVNHFGAVWAARLSTTSCFSSSIASGFGLHYPSSRRQQFQRRHFKITFCSNCPRRDRFCQWVKVSARAAVGPVLSEDVFLYGNTSGTPLTVLGCPFDAGGVMPAIADDGNGCANRQSVSHSSADHEQVQTVSHRSQHR